jgi:hypothetical protein
VVSAPQPLPTCVRQGQANECRRWHGGSLNAEAAAWECLVALLLAGLAGGADQDSAGVVGGAVGCSRLSRVGAEGAGREVRVKGRRGRHIRRNLIWSAWLVGSGWSQLCRRRVLELAAAAWRCPYCYQGCDLSAAAAGRARVLGRGFSLPQCSQCRTGPHSHCLTPPPAIPQPCLPPKPDGVSTRRSTANGQRSMLQDCALCIGACTRSYIYLKNIGDRIPLSHEKITLSSHLSCEN